MGISSIHSLSSIRVIYNYLPSLFLSLSLSLSPSDDLENRFSFKTDIPPPEKFVHGPKIYPSKNQPSEESTIMTACDNYIDRLGILLISLNFFYQEQIMPKDINTFLKIPLGIIVLLLPLLIDSTMHIHACFKYIFILIAIYFFRSGPKSSTNGSEGRGTSTSPAPSSLAENCIIVIIFV